MKILNEKIIILERELSELDLFVLSFVQILEKYVSYTLVSGYVAILFGRSRGTEDVDIISDKLSKEQFGKLYQELLKNNFWALNADSEEELFSLLNEKIAVRFAEKGKVIPNIELKFVKDELDHFTLREKVKVVTERGDIFVPNLSLQVAYKKFVLGSPKDLEDALHLQKLFHISEENINKYKQLFEQYGRI